MVKVSWKTLVLEALILILVKVSWKMLVLEAWILTFGESLVQNARFGSLDCRLWWKSRGKCSFWKTYYITLTLRYITLLYITLHYITLHTLHYITLHCFTFITLHALHTLHGIHYAHYITLHVKRPSRVACA